MACWSSTAVRPLRANRAAVWNGNVAVDVYSLGRNVNKIAGANTGLGRNEQSPRTRLKNCDADNVSDAKSEVPRSAPILKFADKPRRGLRQDVRDLGGYSDEGVWKIFRVGLARPDIPAGGHAGRHECAPAHRSRQER